MVELKMNSTLRAGVARVDVTPPLGTLLGGYPAKRPAESINDNLNSTALVFERDGRMAALISLDWLGIEEEDMYVIRSQVFAQTNIAEDDVIICAIHSHTTANTISLPGWGDKDKSYIANSIPKIVESVKKAQDTMLPVRIGVKSIPSNTGVNRYLINEEHQLTFGENPDGIFDPTMTVMRFETSEGPLCALIHYGAHPTAFGGGQAISRDWPGAMMDCVEKQIGVPVVFINGAIGDVGPRKNFVLENGFSAGGESGLDAVIKIGSRAAADAMKAFVQIKEFDDNPDFGMITRCILMPYDPLPDMELVRQKLKEFEPQKEKNGRGRFEYIRWERILAALKGEAEKGKIYRQTILRLGTVALVPFPGEIYSSISLRLRRYSPFAHTLCASTSNGFYCYFPTREAIHRMGYAVWMSKAFNGYGLVDNIDDILVEENLALLRNLEEC